MPSVCATSVQVEQYGGIELHSRLKSLVSCLFDIGGIWCPLVAVWTPDLMSIAFFVIIMVITSRGPRPT